jgi:hypothetical protein
MTGPESKPPIAGQPHALSAAERERQKEVLFAEMGLANAAARTGSPLVGR